MSKSKLMAKVIGNVRFRVRFGHESGQVDNFAVSFFVNKIDRGDSPKSLWVILVSEVLIKTTIIFILKAPVFTVLCVTMA